MVQARKWFEHNSVLIGLAITFIGGLFWVFNIHATGVQNTKDVQSNYEHITTHCEEITQRKIVDERIESKLDILLLINNIDPNKVKQTNKYIVTERGVEFDTIDKEEYLKQLTLK